MNFEEAFEKYGPQIRRLCHRQYMPGMDPDDVASEMLVCLWRAVDIWDGVRPFGTLWWTLWQRRLADYLEAYYAQKRVHAYLMEHLPEKGQRDIIDLVPPSSHPVAAQVWQMIAEGYSTVEIRDRAGISKRSYYDLISQWRTPEVRDLLAP